MKRCACTPISGSVLAIEKGKTASLLQQDCNGTRLTTTLAKAAPKELGLALGKPATGGIAASEFPVGV